MSSSGKVVLEGKWALVTGASRGVGRQVAMGLARRGCNVVAHSRKLEHTAHLCGELEALGVRGVSVAAELSDYRNVDPLVDEALAHSGGLDVVYNNAAVQQPWRDTYDTSIEDYRLSFMVNVMAPIRICDRVLPLMVRRGWGRVVNVTSGIEAIPQLMPYSVSKAALDRYVRDMAPSLEGTGVVLSLVDPGWLKTDMGSASAPDDVETALPGCLVPALLPSDAPSGQFFQAQELRNWADE